MSATAYSTGSPAVAPPASPLADSSLVRADAARIQGSASAPVWIIEVSDFQCPFCREWHDSTYAVVKREFIDTGKARFAYYNFPIPQHKNAWPAAEAAMCAGIQGKFWQMHDALFGSQAKWEMEPDPTRVIDGLATAAGVDAAKMRACVTSHITRPLIQADFDRSEERGVHSTPTFLVNGAQLVGAQPIEPFRQAMAAALRKAGSK
ncbi:MAG: thioredoxin domain-containing protein [Gemmatimonadaceae bacterium]